ncbi:MAG: LLM class flavin-dependent oxidoreductase [Actinomycetota bacterium]|nr:LLM class flavin-dependent oxidoreductase [Actinomycetota bacterium]
MADYGHDLQFGVFVTPEADRTEEVIELAELADVSGLDLVTFQDHPYQARFLDTWTLISNVAARTSNVRLAPNVANLPMRPPVVLARSVASLDILSGGRVELGLGAGAFWEAIEAIGGRRLTPGQGVDQLTEAIDVIRSIWDVSARSVRFEGEYYEIRGAHTGPAALHPIEIWLGAYKPRMLALTGAKADGWLPSMGYADPSELGAMNAAIDRAAEEAGRDPSKVRRLYNLTSTFGTGAGFLEGSPADWAEQLAELTLTEGFGTYILSADSESLLQRFAEEVAPAVRDLVEAGRSRPDSDQSSSQRSPGTGASVSEVASGASGETTRGGESRPADFRSDPEAAPFEPVPTPAGESRLSPESPWNESERPVGPEPDPGRLYTPQEQAAGRHLIDVHDGLRQELDRLRELVAQVEQGKLRPQDVRSHINRMTIRQNDWTLGVYCESYCRIVTGHHTLEDRSVFPHLRRSEPELVPVLDRLGEEHDVISELIERVDQALVAMVSGDEDGMDRVRDEVDLLTDALMSHFSYEERELIEPLARVGFQ